MSLLEKWFGSKDGAILCKSLEGMTGKYGDEQERSHRCVLGHIHKR